MFLNIKKLYKCTGKIDDQQQYKAIIEVAMVSNTEGLTRISSMDVGTLINMNNTSKRKFLSQFLELLNVKQNNSVHRLGSAKKNHKEIRTDSALWSIITKWRGHIEINACVKQAMKNWVLHYPHAMQSPIANTCLQVSIDGHTEKQVVP